MNSWDYLNLFLSEKTDQSNLAETGKLPAFIALDCPLYANLCIRTDIHIAALHTVFGSDGIFCFKSRQSIGWLVIVIDMLFFNLFFCVYLIEKIKFIEIHRLMMTHRWIPYCVYFKKAYCWSMYKVDWNIISTVMSVYSIQSPSSTINIMKELLI